MIEKGINRLKIVDALKATLSGLFTDYFLWDSENLAKSCLTGNWRVGKSSMRRYIFVDVWPNIATYQVFVASFNLIKDF
jgi:hypothetical protein